MDETGELQLALDGLVITWVALLQVKQKLRGADESARISKPEANRIRNAWMLFVSAGSGTNGLSGTADNPAA